MRRLAWLTFIAVAILSCAHGGPSLDAVRRSEAVFESKGQPPGRITFTGRNLFRRVEHTFQEWRFLRVEIEEGIGDGTALSGELEVEIDLASVETGNERLNRRAQSAEFFDVERYPTARLWIGNVRRAGNPPESESETWSYEADVELEVRGVESVGTVEFEVMRVEPLVVAGETMLRRSDFGIGPPFRWFNPFSIWDEVPVWFEVRLTE